MEHETISFPYFRPATKANLSQLTLPRNGETRLGENASYWDGDDLPATLQASAAPFVLIGIPEDIGVRANYGVGGAHTAWEPALKALLNVQSIPALNGAELLVLGFFDFSAWMEESLALEPEPLRSYVAQIDDVVAPLIETVVRYGKIPLVVGGGHNNAYPLLKGCSKALDRAVNCVNMDAHSDYRMAEGRHSGNGFRYARKECFLDKYAVVGLHENYNSAPIVAEMQDNPDIHFSWFEAVFLRRELTFDHALQDALAFTDNAPCGIELDLDCIERTLSSAVTPCGIRPIHARRYMLAAAARKPLYLHLTEGAVELRDGRTDTGTGKLIAYLLTDFMKEWLRHQA